MYHNAESTTTHFTVLNKQIVNTKNEQIEFNQQFAKEFMEAIKDNRVTCTIPGISLHDGQTMAKQAEIPKVSSTCNDLTLFKENMSYQTIVIVHDQCPFISLLSFDEDSTNVLFAGDFLDIFNYLQENINNFFLYIDWMIKCSKDSNLSPTSPYSNEQKNNYFQEEYKKFTVNKNKRRTINCYPNLTQQYTAEQYNNLIQDKVLIKDEQKTFTLSSKGLFKDKKQQHSINFNDFLQAITDNQITCNINGISLYNGDFMLNDMVNKTQLPNNFYNNFQNTILIIYEKNPQHKDFVFIQQDEDKLRFWHINERTNDFRYYKYSTNDFLNCIDWVIARNDLQYLENRKKDIISNISKNSTVPPGFLYLYKLPNSKPGSLLLNNNIDLPDLDSEIDFEHDLVTVSPCKLVQIGFFICVIGVVIFIVHNHSIDQQKENKEFIIEESSCNPDSNETIE